MRLVLQLLFVLAAVCLLRSPLAADEAAPWLARVNFYRALASLGPVSEDIALSDAVRQHARYMVRHDRIEHGQDRRRRWSTPAGAAAAAVSNLAGSNRADEPEWWAVDTWMQAPFHALGILDPALEQVGFGIERARDGRIQTAAALDVVNGRASEPAATPAFPIVWPAEGAVVPLSAHVHETPSPLTSCRGYSAPSGLPLIVQLGTGALVPRVRGAHVVDVDARRELETCVFDESSYRNGDRAAEALGRGILAARDAVVIVPRRPLGAGRRYRVILAVEGFDRIDWEFRVAAAGWASADGW